MTLSKSLWLKKHKFKLLTPPDASAQAVFDRGNAVGELACELFPGGVEVAFTKGFGRPWDRWLINFSLSLTASSSSLPLLSKSKPKG